MPPAYGSLEYWNDRFTREDKFEWLLANGRTLQLVEDQLIVLSSRKDKGVLHIGCGNSDLSHNLASLLEDEGMVTNVDFSRAVIEAARSKAAEIESPIDVGRTRWIAADLLVLPDLVKADLTRRGLPEDEGASGDAGFDLVLDKSTSDSIACGDDVRVTLPYPLELSTTNAKQHANEVSDTQQEEATVHPLHLLAVHLALLAPSPGARWLCVSYSPDRFDVLHRDTDDLSSEESGTGLPNPRTLWRVEEKWPVDLCPAEGAGKRSNDIVHRPPEQCWVYVLVRTAIGVRWR